MLDDILDEIQAEQPRQAVRSMSARAETFSYGDELRTARWSPEDKLPSYSLPLSEYERSWLVTRIQVHLKSYEHYEWSEMKDVLQTVLKRLEALAHDRTNSATKGPGGDHLAQTPEMVPPTNGDPSSHANEPGPLSSDWPEAG